MKLMENKMYLFNPFNIKNINEYELKNLFDEVFKELLDQCNTMYEYSHNIEVYANLNYIIGEIVARLKGDIIELKTKIDIDMAINKTSQR